MRIGDPGTETPILAHTGKTIRSMKFNRNAIWVTMEDNSYVQATIVKQGDNAVLEIMGFDPRKSSTIANL